MAPADAVPPDRLVDRFGRVHTSLRIGVTDRCNLRCRYCMPEQVEFLPRSEILTFEEIERVTRVACRLGIRKVRITGGEPLVRRNVTDLVARLRRLPELEEIALTTNGLLLADHAAALKEAGLDRLNISLDSVRPEVFGEWTRRDALPRVLEGIDAALQAGLDSIRLNALAIRGLTEKEIGPLLHFARSKELEIRFIEFMHIDGEGQWERESVLTGAEIRRQIEAEFGKLSERPRPDPAQPARDYVLPNGTRVGLICSVSEPFCETCNRLRLTAEGQLRNCLFSKVSWDIRELLRSGADDVSLMERMRECIAAKKRGHGTDDPSMLRPDLAMYQIGG